MSESPAASRSAHTDGSTGGGARDPGLAQARQSAAEAYGSGRARDTVEQASQAAGSPIAENGSLRTH